MQILWNLPISCDGRYLASSLGSRESICAYLKSTAAASGDSGHTDEIIAERQSSGRSIAERNPRNKALPCALIQRDVPRVKMGARHELLAAARARIRQQRPPSNPVALASNLKVAEIRGTLTHLGLGRL
jgi:hypothetical protein